MSQPQSIDYFGVAILVYNYHLLNNALNTLFNSLPFALMLVIVAGFTGLYKIGHAIGYVIGFLVGGLGAFQVALFPVLYAWHSSGSLPSLCGWIAAFFAILGALGMGYVISRIPCLIGDLIETPGRPDNPYAMLSVIVVTAVITLMIWGVTQTTQQRQNQMVVQAQLAVIATQDAPLAATQDALERTQTPGSTPPDARAFAAQTQVMLDRAILATEASNLLIKGRGQELETDTTPIFLLLCCAGVVAVPVGILLILNGLVSLQSRL